MSDLHAPGPTHPSRIIFLATALIGAAVGIGTGDIRWFFQAVIGSAVLLCASYSLIRIPLGWKPLRFDDLFDLMRLLGPH